MNVHQLAIRLIPYLDLNWDECDLSPAAMPDAATAEEIQALSEPERHELVEVLRIAAKTGLMMRGHNADAAHWSAISQARHLGDPHFLGLPDLEWTKADAVNFISCMFTINHRGALRGEDYAFYQDWEAMAPALVGGLFDLLMLLAVDDRRVLFESAVRERTDEIAEVFREKSQKIMRLITEDLLAEADRLLTSIERQ